MIYNKGSISIHWGNVADTVECGLSFIVLYLGCLPNIYIHKGYWFVIFFSYVILICLWYQGNTSPVK